MKKLKLVKAISNFKQYSAYRKLILDNNFSESLNNKKPNFKKIFIDPSEILLICSSGSWHKSLIKSFKAVFGSNLNHFDYRLFNITPYNLYSNFGYQFRNKVEFLIEKIINEKNIKLLGGYFDGFLIRPSFLLKLKNKYHLRTFNISFDDRQSWQNRVFEFQNSYRNLRDITKHIDYFFTSSKITLNWHLHENGNPIYLPEGGDSDIYKYLPYKKREKLVFFGSNYGNREKIINYLKNCGINVACYGIGWGNRGNLNENDILKVLSNAYCVLGDGYVGNMSMITTLKARDFEIPMTSIPYLTSYHHELADIYEINKDIWCYNHYTEIPLILEKIRNLDSKVLKRLKDNSEKFRKNNSWESRISEMKNTMKINIKK